MSGVKPASISKHVFLKTSYNTLHTKKWKQLPAISPCVKISCVMVKQNDAAIKPLESIIPAMTAVYLAPKRFKTMPTKGPTGKSNNRQ